MARKIMVGMSGGVDSSVAAYLLKKQGYEVTGVTFKLWDDPTLESGCCSADDVRDAAYVCQQLGRTPASAATDILNLGPFPISSGSWALT